MKLQNTHAGLFLSKTILATAMFGLALAGTVHSQTDDFNDGNDNGWTHYDPLAPFGAGATYSFPSGGYRIQAPASPNPGAFGAARAGSFRSDAFYSDFSVSVDLVDWNNSLQQGFGLAARISQPGLGTTDGYVFYYAQAFGQAIFSRLTDENNIPIFGGPLVLDPAQDYRFSLSGAGSNFAAQIYNLTDLVNPVFSVNGSDSTYSAGVTGVFEAPTAASATLDATFDNFRAVPEPSATALLGLSALPFFGRRRRSSRHTHAGLFLSKTILATAMFALAFAGNVHSQIVDDFNDGNDNGWTHYDPLAPFGAGATYSFPSGGYRIQAPGSPNPGASGVARAGSFRSDAFYSDFSASVDLVDWNNSLGQGFGLAARISQPGLGTTDGYTFVYVPAFAEAIFARVTNEGILPIGGAPALLNPAQDYRFVLSGTGSNFVAQIYNLTDLVNPVVSFGATDSTYSAGVTGIVEAANADAPTSSLDATFDNFRAVPEPSTTALLGFAALACLGARRRSAAHSKSTAI